MKTVIYKIKIYKSISELNDAYDRLSDEEKAKVYGLNAESFFDYEDEYFRYTCYVIAHIDEIKKYLSLLKSGRIEFEAVDLSKSILRNETNLDYLSELIGGVNYLKFDFFVFELDNWIYDNLEIDIVLDRINEVGIENLKDVETRFLKDYKSEEDEI